MSDDEKKERWQNVVGRWAARRGGEIDLSRGLMLVGAAFLAIGIILFVIGRIFAF